MIIALGLHQLSTGSIPFSTDAELVQASSCNDRSIYDIVWSCLTTIFACTWIAIHPNIPEPQERPFLRRLKVFALALVAPELIVLWSMRQWLASRKLVFKYKEFGWTQTHGFFAIMGGFHVRKDDSYPYSPLHPDDFGPYLKNGDIVITEKEIWDKSKGDFLTKTLVLLQVTWFLLQVLARAVQRLAVTELEVVTLAFASLNFMTYFCWWKKPLDVICPIRVATYFTPSSSSQQDETPDSIVTCAPGHSSIGPASASATTIPIPEQAILSSHRKLCHDPSYLNTFGAGLWRRANLNMNHSTCNLTESSINAIRRVFDFIAWFAVASMRMVYVVNLLTRELLTMTIRESVRPTYPYFCGTLGPQENSIAERIACGAAMGYGAIHCLAWNFGFPSQTERLIWRVLSIILLCLPIYPMTVARWRAGKKGRFFWLFYMSVRLLLFVEIFVVLRKPNSEVFTPVDWATYIPHL